jgi:RimJ/RimL family protein N-acetyltransferase
MPQDIPIQTIQAVARSIHKETTNYGFGPIDTIRLINQLMDLCNDDSESDSSTTLHTGRPPENHPDKPSNMPLTGERIRIREFHADDDLELLRGWLPDKYGRYFVLSCATAQATEIETLVSSPLNRLGIITLHSGEPIGAMAYLDYNEGQKRAELRKLIGNPESRGMGYAEEATRLWIDYGLRTMGLEKIYVSTLQTHISNIRLNEEIGFKVEGVLQNEVCIDGQRYDVLRMGLCRADHAS